VAATAAVPSAVEAKTGDRPLQNRFLLSAVAFQRAKQLQAGARPRVEDDDHKPARLAVLEALADTVSWSVLPEKGAGG